MPVWHHKTKDLVAAGELVIVGIVQEQHPDRTALYAQFQEFGFPILWDPFGFTGLEVVPVLSAIDEHGVVRIPRPDPRRFDEQFVDGFMAKSFPGPTETSTPASFRMAARDAEGVHGAITRLLRGGPDTPTIDAEVETLRAAAERDPADTIARFRHGVALRLRTDGPHARPGDFQAAVDAWSAALHARPNQYIWRRRIQQWGPRLDKPYPFYDWIDQATKEVAARGETPVPIRVSLSGAEIAGGTRAVPRAQDEVPDEPDPSGSVTRDGGKLVRADVTVAMHTGSAGSQRRAPSGASRVHVTLRPQAGAHWTPDADPPVLWIQSAEGLYLHSPRVDFTAVRSDRAADTAAPLRADFELSTPPVPLVPDGGGPPPDVLQVPAYVLYSVCLEDGTCVFRRQDMTIEIDLPDPPSRGGPGDDDEHGDDDD